MTTVELVTPPAIDVGVNDTDVSVTINDAAPVVVEVSAATFPIADGWYPVTSFGSVDLTGITDSSAAVQAAIDAACATGGVVWFPAGTIRCDSQLTFANDGATPPKQRPVKLQGSGAKQSGQASPGGPYGGTILDLRFTGSPAKMLTLGNGLLELEGLTFTNLGTADTTPFLMTTSTVLHVHDCGFIGDAGKANATCNQDAIILGGTSETLDGSTNAPFQGYGTVIQNNWFSRIRRGVYMRTFCNGVVVRDNNWWNTCGGICAIEIDGGTSTVVGNVIASNLFECIGYTSILKLTSGASGNQFIFNNIYDTSGCTQYCLVSTGCTFNLFIAGQHTDDATFVTEQGTAIGTSTIWNWHQSQASRFSQPTEFSNAGTGLVVSGKATFAGGSNLTIIQPTENQIEGAKLLLVKRSAADDTNPGGEIFSISNGAELNLYDASGAQVQFASGAKTWQAVGVGGAFTIFTGSGGSPLILRSYGTRFTSYDGNHSATKHVGAGDPNGNLAGVIGDEFTDTTGLSGHVLWVKESGTGNTGWVGK